MQKKSPKRLPYQTDIIHKCLRDERPGLKWIIGYQLEEVEMRSAYHLYGKTGCSSGKINGTVHSNGNFPE